MARNNKSKNRNNPYRPNVWGWLRDVLIASMDRGQLPGMTIAVILIILFIRYPSDEIPELIDKLLNISNLNRILGWIVAGVVVFGGYLVTRWLKITHTKEIQRISDEKKELQQQLSNNKLPTSNKH